ncbi:MAG: alpha/beta hydrolase [bacterium]
MTATLPDVRFVMGAGLRLAYREWNEDARGLPLVTLHGITRSSASWDETAGHLPGRRVIAFDARGHGESDWDPEEGYTADMHFADVAEALDGLSIERCIIVGFSMGGATAMLTAACLPDRIAGLVVVDAYPDPEQTVGSAQIARWVSGRTPLTAGFDPAISRKFSEMIAAGLATRADLRGIWAAVPCPALVIRGAESDVLPFETAQRMLAALPQARLATVAGVGHGIPYSKPKELAELLETFARETECGGA